MADAWDIPPNTLTGCPIAGDTKLIVEMFRPGEIGRQYGELTYGGELYGDPDDDTGWEDATPYLIGVEITTGAADGSPSIPVSQATLDFLDDGERPIFSFVPDSNSPTVGTITRVSLASNDGLTVNTIFVGRIELVVDDHDDTGARRVQITVYDMVADLSNSPATIFRGSESAQVRLEAMQAAAGWWWNPTSTYPDNGHPLLPLEEVVNGQYRALMDNAAISSQWYMDTHGDGRLRYREWPSIKSATPAGFNVTDCPGQTDIASPSIVYVADTAETLNVVNVSNVADPPLTSTQENLPSIERFGRRSNGLGFPLSGLHTAVQTDLDTFVSQAITTYDRVVNRVESFDLDTGTDVRWADVLLTLDTGQSVDVNRTGLDPMTISGVICGYTLRMVRGRATATIEMTTTTETEYEPTAFYLTNGIENLLNGTQQLTNE